MENLGPQATNALQFAAFADMTEDRVESDRSMSARENNFTLDRAYRANRRASSSPFSIAFGVDQTETRPHDIQHSQASSDYANTPRLGGPKPQPLANNSLSTDPSREKNQRGLTAPAHR